MRSSACLGKDVPVQSGYRLPPTKCAAVAAATVGADALSSGNDSYQFFVRHPAACGGWTLE